MMEGQAPVYCCDADGNGYIIASELMKDQCFWGTFSCYAGIHGIIMCVPKKWRG